MDENTDLFFLGAIVIIPAKWHWRLVFLLIINALTQNSILCYYTQCSCCCSSTVLCTGKFCFQQSLPQGLEHDCSTPKDTNIFLWSHTLFSGVHCQLWYGCLVWHIQLSSGLQDLCTGIMTTILMSDFKWWGHELDIINFPSPQDRQPECMLIISFRSSLIVSWIWFLKGN